MKGASMYEQVGYAGALIFLGCIAGEDIRTKRISVNSLLLFGSLAILYLMAGNLLEIEEMICRMLPGFSLLLLSMLTKESIGYGDGVSMLIVGLWTSGFCCFRMICLGIGMTGFVAVYKLIMKSETEIPLIPFLLVAMEVMILYEM